MARKILHIGAVLRHNLFADSDMRFTCHLQMQDLKVNSKESLELQTEGTGPECIVENAGAKINI